MAAGQTSAPGVGSTDITTFFVELIPFKKLSQYIQDPSGDDTVFSLLETRVDFADRVDCPSCST
jgi:hypothetical protein